MSHDWFNNVYQATGKSAHDIMGQIELMLEALKSSFFGAGFPSDPVAGMWCLNTTDHCVYVRNEANDAWIQVFNLNTLVSVLPPAAGAILTAMMADGAVTAVKINDAARKPSLIDGETIAPANCNATTEVSAPTGTFTTLSATNFVAPHSVIASIPAGVDAINVSSTSPAIVYRCYVYVSSLATTMRMATRLKGSYTTTTAYARFTINGANSNSNARTSQTYGWVNNASVDVSSLSGYYEVVISLWSYNPNAYMDGMTLFIQ